MSDTPPVNEDVKIGTSQLYNVPIGTIPLVKFVGDETNSAPLQTTVVIAVISGVGFTNTVTVNILPSQLPAFGITSYVAVRTTFVLFHNKPDIVVSTFSADTPPVIVPEYVGTPQR